MKLLNLLRLTSFVNFKTKKNRRQDATLRNTHLLLVHIRLSGLSSHLEQSMGQTTTINEGRQTVFKFKLVEIR